MKNLLILTICLLLFPFCKDGSPQKMTVWICNCKEKEAAAQWVKETIQSANNMSDEEMEDVVKQLQKTSIQLHCHTEIIETTYEANRVFPALVQDSCRVIFYW